MSYMNRLLGRLIVVSMAVGASSDDKFRRQASAPAKVPLSKKAPLLQRLIQSNEQLVPIAPEKLPGMREIIKTLNQPACRAAVGGQRYYDLVVTRLETVTYLTVSRPHISAEEQEEDGGIDVDIAFAYSDIQRRLIVVFQSLLTPDRALTRVNAGGTKNMDLRPLIERSLGFKPGSLKPSTVQVLFILHEHAHLNGMAIEDWSCTFLSMVNSRHIAEACTPEIIDNPPLKMTAYGSPKALFVKLSRGAAKRCGMCHKS